MGVLQRSSQCILELQATERPSKYSEREERERERERERRERERERERERINQSST